jgi:hypothetical protein
MTGVGALASDVQLRDSQVLPMAYLKLIACLQVVDLRECLRVGMSEANRDEAMKCLGIARKARADGDFAKAKRFAEKARSLYPCAEVCWFFAIWLAVITP